MRKSKCVFLVGFLKFREHVVGFVLFYVLLLQMSVDVQNGGTFAVLILVLFWFLVLSYHVSLVMCLSQVTHHVFSQ